MKHTAQFSLFKVEYSFVSWMFYVYFHRKQCIELEQQFDFLKDLVATVPDMQGEGEENHTEGGGEKVLRRYWSFFLSLRPCVVALVSLISEDTPWGFSARMVMLLFMIIIKKNICFFHLHTSICSV